MKMNITKKIATVIITAIFTLTAPIAAFAQSGPAGFADLAEKLSPAVVNISTMQKVKLSNSGIPGMEGFPPGLQKEFSKRFGGKNKNGKERTRKRRSLGSGFIIAASGIVITNNHVVKDADEITVKLFDGTELKAKLIGRDNKVDIAVLQLIMKKKKALPFVTFGDSDKTRVGHWVLAFGNPYGIGLSVTAGIISASHRSISNNAFDNYLQTDASINRGNSGGPMFDMNGKVIGINTAIFSPTGGNVGIGFAIPSNQAIKIIKQIREFGHAKRGRIGVMIGVVSDEIAESLGMDETYGAMVQEVVEDGPAEKGGIKAGDIILKFNDQKVEDNKALSRIVANTVIGAKVPVIVLREGKEKDLSLTIAEMENDTMKSGKEAADSDELSEVLGMELEDITKKTREILKLDKKITGALISSVDPDSAAFEKGLRRGDVITQIAYKDVKNVKETLKRIKQVKKQGRSSVLLKAYRMGRSGAKGQAFYLGIKFAAEEDKE